MHWFMDEETGQMMGLGQLVQAPTRLPGVARPRMPGVVSPGVPTGPQRPKPGTLKGVTASVWGGDSVATMDDFAVITAESLDQVKQIARAIKKCMGIRVVGLGPPGSYPDVLV